MAGLVVCPLCRQQFLISPQNVSPVAPQSPTQTAPIQPPPVTRRQSPTTINNRPQVSTRAIVIAVAAVVASLGVPVLFFWAWHAISGVVLVTSGESSGRTRAFTVPDGWYYCGRLEQRNFNLSGVLFSVRREGSEDRIHGYQARFRDEWKTKPLPGGTYRIQVLDLGDGTTTLGSWEVTVYRGSGKYVPRKQAETDPAFDSFFRAADETSEKSAPSYTSSKLDTIRQGDQSLRLDIADRLAVYFGLELVAKNYSTRKVSK
jgi:hypothetical protein